MEGDPPAPSSVQVTAASVSNLTPASWETPSQSHHLNCSKIPEPQELPEIINVYCCFKLLNFREICYAIIDN